MPETTFHLFLNLPAEIRRQIYLEATKPRFVHVSEYPDRTDEDAERDEFEEFLGSPLGIHLDLPPSLTYFAHIWRQHFIAPPSSRKDWTFRPRLYRPMWQTELTSYGFTTNRKRYEAWPPTSQAPHVPMDQLLNQPELAWQFTRKSQLYSLAPIPPLLHTSRESRHTLIDYGYELTFRTRSHGPAVWFHYRDDVLFLFSMGDQGSHLMDGGDYNIGQFMPADLRRVRRLALSRRGHIDCVEFSRALRLFHGIEELFCVQGTEEEGFSKPKGSLWGWVDCDEADDYIDPGSPIEHMKYRLENFHRRHIRGWDTTRDESTMGFFDHIAENCTTRLRAVRDEVVKVEGVAPWAIPTTKFVQVGSMPWVKQLFKHRDFFWNELDRKESVELERGVSPENRIYSVGPPSPFSQAWMDDWEAYNDSLGYY